MALFFLIDGTEPDLENVGGTDWYRIGIFGCGEGGAEELQNGVVVSSDDVLDPAG